MEDSCGEFSHCRSLVDKEPTIITHTIKIRENHNKSLKRLLTNSKNSI